MVAGSIGFIIFLAIYPFIMVAIKLESPGPVLFKQLRIGLNGRKFFLYKFRSMHVNAESRKNALLKNCAAPWPEYICKIDPRVTRVGHFLRKTSLDEFPQFINILKGEMSLVGTRPPTPNEVQHYDSWHRRRISLKPGLTGLWQVSGRKEITDFNQVVKLDLKYIDNYRFRDDLLILWKTLWAVLARKGAQ
jgi:lipopolysaccharide/colanic/teichoic acid biosynthesis glycosyltransferase